VSIYENVKKACEEKGVSIAYIEEKLKFPRGSIYKMGESKPNVFKVQALAKELDKPMEFFLKED